MEKYKLNFGTLEKAGTLFCISLVLTSCSVLVGNVKPIEGKSRGHEWMNLARESQEWKEIDPNTLKTSPGAPEEEEESLDDIPDGVYQHKKTGAFISINSSCNHDLGPNPEVDLDAYTTALFPGLSNVKERISDRAMLDGSIALKTQIEGDLVEDQEDGKPPRGEKVKIETYVVASGSCLYDLVYVAKTRYFPKHQADFSKFVKSFRLPSAK